MIRLMRPSDVSGAMRLKEAAGWNQTEQDWLNLLALEPEGCWVDEQQGEIVGSTTAVCYGRDLAWIGMVLVRPDCRGRGLARGLMEHCLEWLQNRGVRQVKLDATDMGRPLYEKLGFRDERAIERWWRAGEAAGPRAADSGRKLAGISGQGSVETSLDAARKSACATSPEAACFDNFVAHALSVPSSHSCELLRPESGEKSVSGLTDIVRLDREAFGADRSRLLEQLLGSFQGQGVSCPGGFILGRPGSRAYFLGPCTAKDAATAQQLVQAMLARTPAPGFFWDLLPDVSSVAQVARDLGFECRRRLMRMALHPEIASSGRPERVFAAAGFEYG